MRKNHECCHIWERRIEAHYQNLKFLYYPNRICRVKRCKPYCLHIIYAWPFLKALSYKLTYGLNRQVGCLNLPERPAFLFQKTFLYDSLFYEKSRIRMLFVHKSLPYFTTAKLKFYRLRLRNARRPAIPASPKYS
jgi:hypothetical protein